MRNKIYLADDNESMRELLNKALGMFFPKYSGMIDSFDNGKSLYEGIVKNEKEIKLVFTDNNMPEMNGLEVIKRCANLYPEIPFIQMSGENIKEEAFEAGAREFILKPFDLAVLKQTLKKYI